MQIKYTSTGLVGSGISEKTAIADVERDCFDHDTILIPVKISTETGAAYNPVAKMSVKTSDAKGVKRLLVQTRFPLPKILTDPLTGQMTGWDGSSSQEMTLNQTLIVPNSLYRDLNSTDDTRVCLAHSFISLLGKMSSAFTGLLHGAEAYAKIRDTREAESSSNILAGFLPTDPGTQTPLAAAVRVSLAGIDDAELRAEIRSAMNQFPLTRAGKGLCPMPQVDEVVGAMPACVFHDVG